MLDILTISNILGTIVAWNIKAMLTTLARFSR